MSPPSPHLRLVPPSSPAPESAPTDDALMLRAAEGNAAAFTLLVRRYEARVRGLCSLLLGEEALAREVAQDVFLQLWSARARYRPQGRLRELLFTLARNGCRTALRRRRVRAFVSRLLGAEEEGERTVPGPGPQERLEAEERQALVARALLQLPEHFRLPLALRFCDELPYEEIARIIGRTPSAARSRVHYGLKALAALLPPEVLP